MAHLGTPPERELLDVVSRMLAISAAERRLPRARQSSLMALRAAAGDSLPAALQIAGQIGGSSGEAIALAAQDAFVRAFQIGSMVTGAVALAGAAIALLFLPARSRDEVSITLDRDQDRLELEPVLERADV